MGKHNRFQKVTVHRAAITTPLNLILNLHPYIKILVSIVLRLELRPALLLSSTWRPGTVLLRPLNIMLDVAPPCLHRNSYTSCIYWRERNVDSVQVLARKSCRLSKCRISFSAWEVWNNLIVSL
jgi:hypothetical protein